MGKLIPRHIEGTVESALFQGHVVVVYGARQVGKTTLVRQIQNKHEGSVYFNCDEPDVREALTNKTSTEMKSFFGSARLVILDEAQRVQNIGLALKLMVDTFPEVQIIATGSSSFDLSGKIAEPLTGRKREFLLFPFSWEELTANFSPIEMNRLLEERLVRGMYPGVLLGEGAESEKRLEELAGSYSYKDVLAYQDIRNPELLEQLLRAIALQVGNEVSYRELAETVGANKQTILNYIRILEQAFIIFRVGSFSRNLRNELKRKRKIYFYDTGIRNALINNLNALSFRQDVGALWENFLMSERLKLNRNHDRQAAMYFWRTFSGKEVDCVEDYRGAISGFEFKWGKKSFSAPKEFRRAYPDSPITLVNRDTLSAFLLPETKDGIAQ